MKPRGRWRNICSATFRSILCGALMLAPTGCRSVYRLRCTSDPTPAGVLVGQEFLGETECTVEIPAQSAWIQDGRIELTFCLPEGTEKTQIVDLSRRKPSNPLAEIISWPFLAAGVGLACLSHDSDEDDEDVAYWDEDEDEDRELTLLGLGSLGIGAGVYLLLGGDFDSMSPCHVHVDFNEPAAEQ